MTLLSASEDSGLGVASVQDGKIPFEESAFAYVAQRNRLSVRISLRTFVRTDRYAPGAQAQTI
jgi:hypothetical protein